MPHHTTTPHTYYHVMSHYFGSFAMLCQFLLVCGGSEYCPLDYLIILTCLLTLLGGSRYIMIYLSDDTYC